MTEKRLAIDDYLSRQEKKPPRHAMTTFITSANVKITIRKDKHLYWRRLYTSLCRAGHHPADAARRAVLDMEAGLFAHLDTPTVLTAGGKAIGTLFDK